MNIRTIRKTECDGLAKLHAKCFARGWSAMELARLASEAGVVALAEGDADIRGFVLARVVLDEAEILTLAVDPACRRAGIGNALLDQLLVKLKRARADTVFLEVSVSNLAAIALYEAKGFARGGRRHQYYADGSDALIMEKTLGE